MMVNRKRRGRLLVTTALVSATLAVAGVTLSAPTMHGAQAAAAFNGIEAAPGKMMEEAAPIAPGDASELFNPAFLARSTCGMGKGKAVMPLFLAVAEAAAKQAPERSAEEETPPLWDHLGSVTFPVTTTSAMAQRYFDQGLRLAYGFNHAEARRSFRMAQRIDPDCAMCYWGEALVLGPNINLPMAPEAVEPALVAVARAQALSDRASEKERALIAALAQRYAADPAVEQSVLDAGYADAMTEVAARYPGDHDIAVLAAEAMMDTQPWDYWEADLQTPKGRTARIVEFLEAVLAENPDHPAAIHLYIHMTEASTTPQRAEPYADRLGGLMPGAGHLVHMPSHTYFRIGRYRDSLAANVAAVNADEAYLAQVDARGIYPNGYYPHNIHMLVESARMAGAADTALAYAQKLNDALADEVVREVAWVQAIKVAPYFAHAQFSDPRTILAVPEPSDDLPYVKSMWHYMRATAHAAEGEVERAEAEADAMARIGATRDFSEIIAGGVPAPDLIALAGHVAAGRIAQAKDDPAQAAEAFRRAVEIQDTLPYMEPPYWYYPVRQSLGAALLEQGNAAEAEMVIRRALMSSPNSGWALYGLMEAQKRQGDTVGATQTAKLLDDAWLGEKEALTLARL